ncbi:metallophosphoesterase [Sphingomonas glacialis]|uniref:Phosphohydrolase n=1 Tax=Sphingomonas glacialis TaxID=658225 RepID=A0A502FQG8_9SPHN|nr:metallophosphoesterase [Sphingomonas glacialis]TPG51695.1 phosphohydrolase [Sphingomonas glacialis]
MHFFFNATATPIERTATVALDGLPKGSKPIRVALLSDIHVGNVGMRPARLAQIVRAVNAARPDLVLLAGDFVIGEQKAGAAMRALDLAPLAGLRATGGVYAVLGNHDHWTDPAAIRQNLARAGVRVLENEAIRSGPLALVGIGDRFSRHYDLARSVARADAVGGVPLAFTHSPDIAPDLPSRFQMLLAGHTHCGQVVLPWIGPLVRTSHGHRLYDPRYRCGRIDTAGRSVFVTAGVGSGTLPLRIGAMPDWWLIVLTPRPS